MSVVILEMASIQKSRKIRREDTCIYVNKGSIRLDHITVDSYKFVTQSIKKSTENLKK